MIHYYFYIIQYEGYKSNHIALIFSDRTSSNSHKKSAAKFAAQTHYLILRLISRDQFGNQTLDV